MDEISDNKRGYNRSENIRFVTIRVSGETQKFEAFMVDVSEGGLQVRSKRSLEPNVHCTIDFSLAEDKVMTVHGEVRRCNQVENSDYYAIGFQLLNEKEAVENQIFLTNDDHSDEKTHYIPFDYEELRKAI